MSLEKYGLMVQIVASMPDEDSKTRCSSAVRLREHSLASFASGNFTQAIKHAETGIDLVPNVPAAEPLKGLLYGVKGLAFFQMGNYPGSIEVGKKAIACLEGHSAFIDELATALNAYGGALLVSGDTQASVDAFERAISIWRNIPRSAAKISDCKDNLRIANIHRSTAKQSRRWWKFW